MVRPAESRLVQPPEVLGDRGVLRGFPQVFTHNCDDLMHHPGAAISPAAPRAGAADGRLGVKGVPIMNLSGTAFDGALSPTPHYYARQPGQFQSRATGVGLARADDPAQRHARLRDGLSAASRGYRAGQASGVGEDDACRHPDLELSPV